MLELYEPTAAYAMTAKENHRIYCLFLRIDKKHPLMLEIKWKSMFMEWIKGGKNTTWCPMLCMLQGMICSIHIELFVGVGLLLVQVFARSDPPSFFFFFFLILLYCGVTKNIKVALIFWLDFLSTLVM